jgi:hypothetical protein
MMRSTLLPSWTLSSKKSAGKFSIAAIARRMRRPV